MLAFKAKILVIGPSRVGKSYLSNYLGDATESSGGLYHPTQGVRILEFESKGVDPDTGKPFRADVELWDCSGDHSFESCWPVFWRDATGVLLVYNPDQPEQLKELERWYMSFVSRQKLQDSQCLLFAHHKPDTPEMEELPPPSELLSGVYCAHTELGEEHQKVREEFNGFLLSLLTSVKGQQEQEELGIVNHTDTS